MSSKQAQMKSDADPGCGRIDLYLAPEGFKSRASTSRQGHPQRASSFLYPNPVGMTLGHVPGGWRAVL